MLVMTLTAFATDYTGHRTVTFGSMPSTESDDAVLTITDNGDNTFNVTFKDVINVDGNYTDNYGTFIFSNVAGTTENGVTTIDLSNLSASLENCALGLKEASDGVLFAKFNAEKAYAKFSAKIGSYYKSTISAEFGVNDFESTGGGSTGGGDEKPAAFEKVDFVGDGTNFNWSIPVDWDTQKIVMSISTATCTTGCEHIIGLGVDGTSWAGNLHMYRTSSDKQLQCYFGAGAINTGKFDEGNPIKVEISKANGFIVDGTTRITAEQLADLFTMSTVVMGTGEGSNILSHATYNYVKVVDKDWTETTEPEVTVTFEKQYADQLYSLVDGAPNAMGDATVTIKEMSDNTISMSLDFSGMNVESTDLVKGTDEKERITYTGTANFQGTNYAVKAFRYTENEEEKLYMTLTTGATVLAFGSDPDYVAPGEPEDVTLWENYQADGTGFSKTATINWDKQKIVASIDFSNGGDDKDILAMTTGESFAAFQTSTYRTMHWYCQQSVKQMSGFFAKDGAGNNNTGRMDVADCLAKFEISKAEGLKVNGEVKMSPEALDELFASKTVLIGSGESPKFSQAFYNYIKVVSLDWTEPTTPDTPEAKVYKNTLKIVRGTDTKTYEDAEVSVLAKGEGKYEVVLPEFADMDTAEGTSAGTIGKLTFVADGVEADGKLKLTASSVETTQEGGEGWESQTFTASMDATVENDQLAGTFTVVVDGYATMYTYNLYYGVEAPEVVTEVSNNNYTSNLRIIDQTSEDENTYLFQTDEASVNIIKYSDHTYKITLRNITLNEKTSDLVFTGAEVDSDEGGAVVTDETMVRATADAETQNFLGGAVVAQFMWQDVSATEIRMSFVLEGTTLSLAGEFNYEETPDQPKDDYAINFDKDAKQTHSSRYSTSVSLQQTGKDKQTIEFGKTMNGYEDLTTGTEKFTVEAGSEVTPSIGYVGEWMHGYVYIDLDNNKQFSFNADGADQTGTEVVSYSYYKDQNSKGETASSNCNVNPMPAFTAPTTPGTYRIRFKVDWDNIDAGGSVATGNSILNNGGGIYDATLEVVAPVVDGISTINAEVANGEAQLFTVDGVQLSKLQKGLNIVRSADGKVKKVLVK